MLESLSRNGVALAEHNGEQANVSIIVHYKRKYS